MNLLPLVSSLDIERRHLPWASIDNFQAKLRDRAPLILNSDLSSGPGIHWFVCVPCGTRAFLIDPLGPDNPRPHDDLMYEQLKRAGLRPTWYRGRFQYATSTSCGLFSVYCAEHIERMRAQLARLSDDAAIAAIDAAIRDDFGRTADTQDLAVIRAYFKL